MVGEKLVSTKSYDVQSININGTGFTSVGETNVQQSFLINIADGWIYFPEKSENDRMYRIKTDGTGYQKAY